MPLTDAGHVEISSDVDLIIEDKAVPGGIPFATLKARDSVGRVVSALPAGEYLAYPSTLIGQRDQAQVSFVVRSAETTKCHWQSPQAEHVTVRVVDAGGQPTSALSLQVAFGAGSAMVEPTDLGLYKVCLTPGQYRIDLYDSSLRIVLSQVVSSPGSSGGITMRLKQ